MSNTILTLRQLEDVFRNLTCTLLGLNPTDPVNNAKVRLAWPTGGAPGWKITEDVTFLRVVPTNNEYSKQRDTRYTENSNTEVNEITSYTLPISVSWTFYGPNSFDNAETVRNDLFKEDGVLPALNLYLMVDVPVPIYCPELFNGQWWERTDFSATFYEKVTRQGTISAITGANIQIKTEEGITENVNIITE